MDQREYWSEVASLAASITEETWDSMDPKPDTIDDMQEELHERLWETIDGHQWIIYTAYNYDVLRFSENDGYSVENFGAESVIRDGALNTAALAFGALYADVLEHSDFGVIDAAWADAEAC